jgi:signal transduction histidine kinase
MRQSEKLAVVGRLASSIAHEINNPLEAVTNLIYLARFDAESARTIDLLDQAERELRRISLITTETLRFHRQNTQPSLSDVAELLESVVLLHDGRIRQENITIHRRYRTHPKIVCLPSEIRQVLANLVGNAIEAMQGNADLRLLSLRIQVATDIKTGRRGLRLVVADTGSGMSAAAAARVFEAFFTTKETTGTGLGLWVSAEIVKKHRGTLSFRSRQSQPHRGTLFSLFLAETV